MRNAFSYRLSSMRLERGLSQFALGNLAGISQRTIYDYEKGTRYPTLRSLIGLRRALDCTWEELLCGIDVCGGIDV